MGVFFRKIERDSKHVFKNSELFINFGDINKLAIMHTFFDKPANRTSHIQRLRGRWFQATIHAR